MSNHQYSNNCSKYEQASYFLAIFYVLLFVDPKLFKFSATSNTNIPDMLQHSGRAMKHVFHVRYING